MRDYYCRVLGVTPNASEGEIKSAYRRLASRAHPDVNGNSKASVERFMKIQEAYDALRTNKFPASPPPKPTRRPAPQHATASTRRQASPPPASQEPGDFIDEIFETFSRDLESLFSSVSSFFGFGKRKK